MGTETETKMETETKLVKMESFIYKIAFEDKMHDQDNALSKCKRCGEKAWLPADVKHNKKCDVGKALSEK